MELASALSTNGFPFLDRDGAWVPDRSGTYGEQCCRGREYAGLVLRSIKNDGFAPRLGGVIKAISARGGWSAVEIGFCAALAEAASRGH
jgi:hypothetical protein